MGRPPQRPGMVDVELVEEDVVGPPTPRVVPASRRAHLPGRLVTVAVALAVVAVGVGLAELRATRSDIDLLAGAPVPDLTVPFREVWRFEADQAPTVVDDLLLVTDRDGRDLRVRAHGLADGMQRWALTVPADEAISLRCGWSVVAADAPLALCQALGGLVPTARVGTLAQDPGRLLVLDSRDGTLLAEHELPASHLGFAALDDGLILADLAEEGAQGVQVSRVDPLTLVAEWTTALTGSDTSQPRSAVLDVDYGRVSLVMGSSVAVLDGADGTLLAERAQGRGDRPERAELVVAPHGWGVTTLARMWPTSRWYAADGEAPLDLRGQVAEPVLSDGSVPQVVLLAPSWGTAVHAVRAEDGQVLWSYDKGPREPVVRRAGVVVLAGESHLRGVDLRTGAELWNAPIRDLVRVHDVTDGRFLLVTGRTLGVGSTVSAISLTDGSLLWRVAMPAGGRSLMLAGDRVVAVGAGVVIGLG